MTTEPITPRRLKELYDQGRNISALLRETSGTQSNTEEIIELSYDLQTGSYIAKMEDNTMAKTQEAYSRELAGIILSLCTPQSILEAGVGEATTLASLLKNLGAGIKSYGFDLSWSRVAYARKWLQKQGIHGSTLCTGSLFQLPFADDSIDVVYTSHSIEPNGGQEEPILRELHRVARRFLILLEPGYELAGDEARQRMEFHGYCRNLKGISGTLGWEVLDHRLFPYTYNPLNPTALTIIRKSTEADPPVCILACPRYKTALEEIGGMLFSPEAMVVYPIIGGIPCLRIENGIVASKYPDVMK